jgi:hypothetical protein
MYIDTCTVCDCEVHPKRVEILKRTGAPITCLEHSSTQKVTGFQINEGKSERFIQVCTPEQGRLLKKMERKSNQATGGPHPMQGKVIYKDKG